VIANRLVEEPEALPSGSTSEVGLRKSIDEQMAQSPTKSKRSSK
jgi:hypothetical protein